MRRVMLFAGAVVSMVCLARDADALRTKLSQDAKAIAVRRGAAPGCIVVDGVNAIPIAFGKVNGVKVPVMAASTYGKGRVVAVTHHGFFENEAGSRPDNIALLRDCLEWLAGGSAPQFICFEGGSASMAKSVALALGKKADSVRCGKLRGYDDLDSVPPGAVVFTMPDSHSVSDAAKLAAFIQKGGNVLAPVVGWGWHQLNGGKPFSTHSPFNAALGPAGLYTCGKIVEELRDGLYEVAGSQDLPGSTAKSAMELLECRDSKIDRELGARCLSTLEMLAEVLPPDDKVWRPRMEKFKKSAIGIVPSPSHPLGAKNVSERLAYILFQNEWQGNLERNWPASAAAAVYPGVPEKGSVRVTRSVPVEMSVPRWHSTGLFAVAGEPITITLPAGAETVGLRVRVGTTTCRVTGHQTWKRAPVVDMELPLKKKSVTFASPFGGLIYIIVPNKASGKVNVTIGPACPAAWFVEGRDTPETWAAQLRNSPAPFVEMENDHIIITVPRSTVKNLADPRPLLQVWREIMDNDARLAGIPIVRPSPERICLDVQLCVGYMHAGYPIMMPVGSGGRLVSEPTIRAGEEDDVWGFFHEMGHNHQHGDWTFSGTTEITVNFFTLYNMLKICGRPANRTKLGNPAVKRSFDGWNAAGRPADKWFADPFLALYFFSRFADKYGWEAFEKLFAEYRALPQSERPKTDLEKRQQWCRRLSRIVGEDLTEEFKFLLK